MHGLRIGIGVVWICFWVYWLLAASRANASLPGGHAFRARMLVWIAAVLVFRFLHPRGLEIHSVLVGAVGLAVLVCGLAIAIWARVHLGRNWGMPMTQREQPELVTSGPYHWIRHPIYTGLILGIAGTSLAFNLLGLVLALLIGALTYGAARIEERNMDAAFPAEYPSYRARTKMLIPFVL